MCAAAQGKFWAMHDQIFASVASWAESDAPDGIFGGLARELGLDFPAFAKCMSDHVMLPMIRADYQRGRAAGVQSTPSFLIGTTLLSGAAPLETIREAVNKALAR
jgi:protein-disulfide isomerase